MSYCHHLDFWLSIRFDSSTNGSLVLSSCHSSSAVLQQSPSPLQHTFPPNCHLSSWSYYHHLDFSHSMGFGTGTLISLILYPCQCSYTVLPKPPLLFHTFSLPICIYYTCFSLTQRLNTTNSVQKIQYYITNTYILMTWINTAADGCFQNKPTIKKKKLSRTLHFDTLP